ncbi:U9-ctenitoxin-Pr1a-like [Uloborus diversus]|uniref:U9-ctenitoxin-Pr1a-like n=1 Tax=Uloborus diversus TaxID=327109 RepID=UPI002409FE93|nr:U9-ctenitoxin-Pr1a-like [Uloborus diversus]
MKSIILIGFLTCLFVAVSALNETCKTNDDCAEDECCVEIVRFFSSKCKKLRKEGDFCLKGAEEHQLEDKYKFACPCVEGLVCKPAKTVDENGVASFLEDKCQKE